MMPKRDSGALFPSAWGIINDPQGQIRGTQAPAVATKQEPQSKVLS
jgi:hypothetical protein